MKLTPSIPFASCLCGETIYLTRGRLFVNAHVTTHRCMFCGFNLYAIMKQESYV